MKLNGESKEETTSGRQDHTFDYGGTFEDIQTLISVTEATDEERKEVEERMASVVTLKDPDPEPESTYVERSSVEEFTDTTIELESDGDEGSSITDDFDEPEPVIEVTESKPEHKSAERSISDIVKPKINRHIVKNSAAKRILAEFEPDSHITDDQESGTGGELGGGTEASFEEIAEAMKIPYKMNPSGFTVDVFAEWLNKMGIECPDVRAYYKHIMPMIKE